MIFGCCFGDVDVKLDEEDKKEGFDAGVIELNDVAN
jgi:hypothetical protein